MTGPVERATHAPAETPTWVDGIGPPLEQLQEDYSASRVAAEHDAQFRGAPENIEAAGEARVCRDVLALIAEVKRLRAVSGVPEGEPTQEAPDENQSGAGGEQP